MGCRLRLTSEPFPLAPILHRIDKWETIDLGVGKYRLSKGQRRTLRCIHNDGACAFCGLRPTHLARADITKDTRRNGSLRFVAYDPHLEHHVFFNTDHITPTSKGGKDRSSNWQLTCEPCNSNKNNKDAPEYHFLRYRRLCVAIWQQKA